MDWLLVSFIREGVIKFNYFGALYLEADGLARADKEIAAGSQAVQKGMDGFCPIRFGEIDKNILAENDILKGDKTAFRMPHVHMVKPDLAANLVVDPEKGGFAGGKAGLQRRYGCEIFLLQCLRQVPQFLAGIFTFAGASYGFSG